MNTYNLQEMGFCPHQYSFKFYFAAGFSSAIATQILGYKYVHICGNSYKNKTTVSVNSECSRDAGGFRQKIVTIQRTC